MSSRRRAFPLVPDDEPVIGQSTSMHLYENADLINNIHGTYYDKDYAAVTPEISFVRQTKSDEAIKDETKPLERTAGRSYAEAARAKASRRPEGLFFSAFVVLDWCKPCACDLSEVGVSRLGALVGC